MPVNRRKRIVEWVLGLRRARRGGSSHTHRLVARRRFIICVVLALSCAFATSGIGQDTMGLFRLDPTRFFTDVSGGRWVGTGRYFMMNYSDTLVVTPDSTGRGVVLRRVLVNDDDTVVVSRGRGIVTLETGDSTYAIHWSERRYPDVTARMRWQGGQWVVSFDGEWKAWSIRLRYASPLSVIAAAARTIGSLPPMELTNMTYRAQPGG